MFNTAIHNTFVRRSVTIGFALLLIVVSHAALAVSFDCSKASDEAERTICQSPLLSDLDDIMAAAYGRAMLSSSESSTLKDQKVEWIRTSRRCGSDVDCLEAAYLVRIAQLGEAPTQLSPAATPPTSMDTPVTPAIAPDPDQNLPAASESEDGVVDKAVAAVQVAESEVKQSADKLWNEYEGWAIAGVIGFFVYLLAGKSSACPNCGKWFSTNTLATYELGRQGGYETVTREDQHKNTKGEVIGTTTRQEQVYVTYIYYQDHKQCKKCAHEWVTEYTKKV